MSMVIISGNIDISVGSLIGVLATISGSIAVAGWPIWLSWLVPVLVGMAATAVMGFLVAYLSIPSIVVTLGMLSILKGGLISVTGGEWITDLPPGFHCADRACSACRCRSGSWSCSLLLAAFWMRYCGLGRASTPSAATPRPPGSPASAGGAPW